MATENRHRAGSQGRAGAWRVPGHGGRGTPTPGGDRCDGPSDGPVRPRVWPGPTPPPEPYAPDAVPEFDPDLGDRALTEARQDIVIGRWQGVRDLILATGDDWPRRTHRLKILSHAAAASSVSETWLAAEPDSPDALVLRAATDVARAFGEMIAAGGRSAEVDESRLDGVVRGCLRAAAARPGDPAPWISLVTLSRLYPRGVPRPELQHWWDELRRRDPCNVEGHSQLLRYLSARWHGTHGSMYGFARDAAGAAPPGSPLPVLVQVARVEEHRHAVETARVRGSVRDFGQHWHHEIAVTEARRTFERWIGGRPPGPDVPEEVRELNYLAHALCLARLPEEAGEVLTLLGTRATRMPWSYTGDPAEQFMTYRRATLGTARTDG